MKMGLNECVKNELLHGYPVLSEKKGEIVAQFKYTIALRNEGPIVICGNSIDMSKYDSSSKITDEGILKLLEVPNDDFLPNSKKANKMKKDAAEKKAKKKAAKAKKKEEAKGEN